MGFPCAGYISSGDCLFLTLSHAFRHTHTHTHTHTQAQVGVYFHETYLEAAEWSLAGTATNLTITLHFYYTVYPILTLQLADLAEISQFCLQVMQSNMHPHTHSLIHKHTHFDIHFDTQTET
jgi:hypothetical protein